MKWVSRAPANIMLMGEHSVVYGQKALAAALNQTLHIEWETREDANVCIVSDLGQHQTSLKDLAPHPNFQWILETFRHFRPELSHGFNLTVKSEFGSTYGLGSSAAVLSAMLGGLFHYLNKPLEFGALFPVGLNIIHTIQKRGSGTDLATSLTGGMVLFDPKNQTVKKLEQTLPLHLFYSGYKTPTAEVLAQVANLWHKHPDLLDQVYRLMGKVTEQSFQALVSRSFDDFYFFVDRYQGLMDTLGVNDRVLSELVYRLRQTPGIRASKISGSGLGDCVLAFGELDQLPKRLQDAAPFSLEMTAQGLIIEPLA